MLFHQVVYISLQTHKSTWNICNIIQTSRFWITNVQNNILCIHFHTSTLHSLTKDAECEEITAVPFFNNVYGSRIWLSTLSGTYH